MSMPKPLRWIILAWCLYVTINNSVEVEASHHVFPEMQSLSVARVNNLLQPKFHFRPPRNWINDPNGPMYYKGIYHLFYQYNPKGSVFGNNNIVWGHSISMDMIKWKSLKPALSPSKPFDIYGCWSGSATIVRGNQPILLYTGVDTKQRQVQNFAIPANYSDPYLQDWIKPDKNPVVVSGSDTNATQFRDPTTAWLGQDGHWRMLVGSRRNQRGMAYLYRSKDFIKWTKAKHPLHSEANSGMWECPDFYPVPLKGKHGLDVSAYGNSMKHVLKISLDLTRYDYYTVGTYDKKLDRYVPDKSLADDSTGLRYDYGNFYASKTFFDSSRNRRILWGWVNESDTAKDDVAKGWAGLQSLPRSVWLDNSGRQLSQWPIKELETLRGNKVQMKHEKLNIGNHVEIKGITASQADVEVTFLLPDLDKAEPFDPSYAHDAQKLCGKMGSHVQGHVGPFGLLTLASDALEEYTPVFFRIFKAPNKHVVLMCSDARSSSLRKDGLYKPSFAGFVGADLADGKLSLRTLIDHSVVESFGAEGKTCITSRVYPTLAVNKNAHLFVFNNGSEAVTVQKLNAWSMNNANKA